MQKIDNLQMTMCGNCGLVFSGNDHECPEPEEMPAEQRRPTSYSNIMWANLTRADKEQLDRIESKLDKLLGI